MLRWPLQRRGMVIALTLVFVLFAAFEVGVRTITPDAVQYETQSSINGGPIARHGGTITDPATVAKWRAAMTQHPASELLPTVYMHAWLKLDSCVPLGYYATTYRFTWHGLPVEVVEPAPTCGYGRYEISSGGLVDIHMYLIDIGTLAHA